MTLAGVFVWCSSHHKVNWSLVIFYHLYGKLWCVNLLSEEPATINHLFKQIPPCPWNLKVNFVNCYQQKKFTLWLWGNPVSEVPIGKVTGVFAPLKWGDLERRIWGDPTCEVFLCYIRGDYTSLFEVENHPPDTNNDTHPPTHHSFPSAESRSYTKQLTYIWERHKYVRHYLTFHSSQKVFITATCLFSHWRMSKKFFKSTF